MKINEKTLIHFAQSPDNPIDHSGWLLKWDSEKRLFKRRYCVLKENFLFYYEQPKDKEPKGAIILEFFHVECVEDSEKFCFKIDFGDTKDGVPLRCFVFAAESADSMEQWIKYITCASYGYQKMVAIELDHRLKELRKNQGPSSTVLSSSTSSSSKVPSDSGEKPSPTNANVRFNPFDITAPCSADEELTFTELHEEYSKIFVPLFEKYAREVLNKNKNQENDNDIVQDHEKDQTTNALSTE